MAVIGRRAVARLDHPAGGAKRPPQDLGAP